MSLVATLFQVLPVLALFGIGALLRVAGILGPPAAEGIKRLVVGLCLPFVLFDAFFRLELGPRNALLAAAVFGACLAMVPAGRLCARALRLEGRYAPLLYEGFEAGMLGYGLFLGLAGDGGLPTFAACDLGQVLFVFSVLQAQLLGRRGEGGGLRKAALGFIRSPVVVAILLGLAAGLAARAAAAGGSTGAAAFLGAASGGPRDGSLAGMGASAFWRLVATLKSLTGPLVAFVIGAGIGLDRRDLAFSIKVVASRMALLGLAAFVVGDLVAVRLLGFPPLYRLAVYSLFLLPPPFIIPVFMTEGAHDESRRASTALSLHSLASIVAVSLAFMATGGAAA